MGVWARVSRRFRQGGGAFESCVIVCVFAALLWLKLDRIGAFAVVDEPKWAKRSTAFYTALARHDYPETFQSGHPGVVTLWIGTVASGAQSLARHGRLCEAVTIRPEREPLACALDEKTLITQMHVGAALLTWVLLIVSYLCLRNLYGSPCAGVILPLLAFDPFLLAHSRLVHLEGVLSHALLASCLALLSYEKTGRRRQFLLSAILGGVAVAEKLPGLYAFPIAACVLLWSELRRHRGLCAVARWARHAALWSVIAVSTVVLLWPALWSAPGATIEGLLREISGIQAEASPDRHLIFGQVRGSDATLLLYLGTLLYKLTPFSLIGLVVGALIVLADRQSRRQIGPWLAYGAGFVALMSLGTKQGGRYLLSAFPAADIVAGLAFWRASDSIAGRGCAGAVSASRAVAPVVLALSLAYAAPLAPYFLASVNRLLGNPRAIAQQVGVGLGEGLDLAARYLNQKPNAEHLVVATAYREAFAPYFLGESHSIKYPTAYRSDYVVFYVNQWQRRPDWSLWRTYRDHREPEHVVEIQGIRYAVIYANQVPRAAVDHVERNARRGDLVLAELPSLFTRHFRGEATLWVPSEGADEQAVLQELQTEIAQHGTVWWVIYPEARGDYEKPIAQAMSQRACDQGVEEFGELRAECRVACGRR